MRRHTVPTHAGTVEDKLMFGLTVRQLLPLALAATGGAWLWLSTATVLPLPLRLALTALVLVTGAAVALLRLHGVPLPTYLALRLGHRLAPRRALWQRTRGSLPGGPRAQRGTGLGQPRRGGRR